MEIPCAHTREMARALIRTKPKATCATFAAVDELLTSLIMFTEFSEALITPVVLDPGFKVPILVASGGPIVLM